MQIENDRFDKLSRIVDIHEQAYTNLYEQTAQILRDADGTRRLILTTQSRLIDFIDQMHDITVFERAVLLAGQGLLVPDLISVAAINQTINDIRDALQQIHSPFYLLRQRPEDIYASRDFHIWVLNNILHVTLTFPLSLLPKPVTVYRVTAIPIPVPHQPQHVTRIINLPQAVAFAPDDDLFLTFQDTIPQFPESNLLQLDRTTFTLHNKSVDSCISAIVLKDTVKISSLCQFVLQPDVITPQIIPISNTKLLALHISNYQLRCANSTTTYNVTASFVEIELPCSCMFISRYGILPGKTEHCVHKPSTDQDVPHIFPVNLGLLSKFFSAEDRTFLLSLV